ncbi:unnamed protein product, partial [Symbiodinium microadriaticum]
MRKYSTKGCLVDLKWMLPPFLIDLVSDDVCYTFMTGLAKPSQGSFLGVPLSYKRRQERMQAKARQKTESRLLRNPSELDSLKPGQELLERCDLEGPMFYHLTGLLPEQMLYLVWLSTGRRYHWLLDTVSLPGRPMVVDVGAAGGLDSSLYLALGARVVAYEANPFAYNCTASRLEPALRRGLLQLHSAKISRGRGREEFVGSIHALDFERAGEAELPKYTAGRFANTVQLLATSCADIIVEQGTPFYMKIDVEDATKMCLDSLGEIVETSRPALISAEIEDETVLMRLAALGYQSFKIVRQSPHGFLRSTASGACALHGAKLLKESATGLFGDFATDVITGAEWQSFADALDLYTTVANPHVRSAVAAWFPSANSEWYDVHARRTAS